MDCENNLPVEYLVNDYLNKIYNGCFLRSAGYNNIDKQYYLTYKIIQPVGSHLGIEGGTFWSGVAPTKVEAFAALLKDYPEITS